MLKKWLNFLFALVGLLAQSQVCSEISYPSNGATDIPVNATITWPAIDGINGYLISIGTVPDGVDIVDRRSIGQDNFYTAPVGLPENTQIYVSISLVLFDGPPISCAGITFMTTDITTAPPCTILIAPDDNAFNVTIVTDIVWQYAPTATGYRLCMGTVSGGVDILDNVDVGNVLSYEPQTDLPQDTRIYVQVKPFNENGGMDICPEESFFTGPEIDNCEIVLNETTGETRSLRPEIEFPDQLVICTREVPYTITTEDTAEDFRWYRTNTGSPETLLSERDDLAITEPGRYRYEAYNTIIVDGQTIECSNSTLFTVVISEIATINSIDTVNLPDGKEITVETSGNGNYEFALDNADGPYQDSPIFNSIPLGAHTVYVRDKNGCGVVERAVDRDLTSEDFPNFFTPNGDGINDFWQLVTPFENNAINIRAISIFDRYGSLLAQISPESQGWDGNFGGRPLPSSDYWFMALVPNGPEIIGHFALKR